MTEGRRGALILAVEGIDGSGKGTQAKLLDETLTGQGVRTSLISFPRYEKTFFGCRVGDFLNGKFGELADLHPFLVSLLYSGDRLESRDVILDACKNSDLVIFDRYVPSNIAHQSAKVPRAERAELQSWIEQIEYEIYHLPRPDAVILLDTPVDVSQELIARKVRRTYTQQVADLQEADVPYLEKVRHVYRSMAEGAGRWNLVNVVDDEGLRSKEDIASDILQIAQALLMGAAEREL